MTFIYNIIFSIFAIFSIPKFLVRLNQADDGKLLLRERFGILTESLKRVFAGQKVVWIHAVSVGEVMALREWVKLFLKKYPDHMLAISTSTPTGQAVAKQLEEARVKVFYAPFDLSGPVKKTIQAIRPRLILIMETEIWPNLIGEAAKSAIPIGIINGRISPRSFKKYRLIRGWLRSILEKLSFCLVQTKQDHEFFAALGMPEDKISEMGNMKFDQVISNGRVNDIDSFKKKIVPGNLVFVAGSTSGNEEEILLDAFKQLQDRFKNLHLVLAPRHPERVSQVVKTIERFHFKYQLYSEKRETPTEVIVIDQMGLLASLYSFADVVFVGGSLTPHGGQNPIEAAVAKKTILHGPHIFNFKEVYNQLNQHHAAFQIDSEDELMQQIQMLLRHENVREEMGERAWKTVQSMKGATARTLDYLDCYVEKGKQAPTFAEKI